MKIFMTQNGKPWIRLFDASKLQMKNTSALRSAGSAVNRTDIVLGTNYRIRYIMSGIHRSPLHQATHPIREVSIMTKPIRVAIFSLSFSLSLVISGAAPAQDPLQECGQRLRRLGFACILYTRMNQGRMPASLSELAYGGYLTELKAFTCPGAATEILLREQIDAKSDYVLSPPASGGGPRPIVQDRNPSNHGGAGVNVFFSDGSLRWQPVPGGARASAVTKKPAPPPATPPVVIKKPAPPAVPPPVTINKPEPSPAPGREPYHRPAAFSELKVATGQDIFLGVRLHALTPAEARDGKLSVEGGVVVDEVQSGSFAALWGLVTGDILISAAGVELAGIADLSRIIAGSPPGTRLPVMLIRRGMSLQLAIQLGDLPRWLHTRQTAAPAIQGSSAVIRSIRFSLGLDPDGSLMQPGNQFTPQSERIACLIDYTNLPENTEILVEWRRAESVLARSLGVVDGEGLLVCYLYALRNVPFDPGAYRVHIIVRGRAEAAASFEVR